jgi:hypothetical protein
MGLSILDEENSKYEERKYWLLFFVLRTSLFVLCLFFAKTPVGGGKKGKIENAGPAEACARPERKTEKMGNLPKESTEFAL